VQRRPVHLRRHGQDPVLGQGDGPRRSGPVAERYLLQQHRHGNRDGQRLLRRDGQLQAQPGLQNLRHRQGLNHHDRHVQRRPVHLRRHGQDPVLGRGHRPRRSQAGCDAGELLQQHRRGHRDGQRLLRRDRQLQVEQRHQGLHHRQGEAKRDHHMVRLDLRRQLQRRQRAG
jgi:hypothetical protein